MAYTIDLISFKVWHPPFKWKFSHCKLPLLYSTEERERKQIIAPEKNLPSRAISKENRLKSHFSSHLETWSGFFRRSYCTYYVYSRHSRTNAIFAAPGLYNSLQQETFIVSSHIQLLLSNRTFQFHPAFDSFCSLMYNAFAVESIILNNLRFNNTPIAPLSGYVEQVLSFGP